jgi:hypothetical protein
MIDLLDFAVMFFQFINKEERRKVVEQYLVKERYEDAVAKMGKFKEQLRPLLATPLTDGEILLGKAIATLLPTLAISLRSIFRRALAQWLFCFVPFNQK